MSDSSISSTICWLFSARSLVACTSMPAVTLRQQLGASMRSPFDLDHAGAAVAVGPQPFLVAKPRDLHAMPLRGLQDASRPRRPATARPSSVNSTVCGISSFSLAGAFIRSPAAKYFWTQRIGFGAACPRPQIDASPITCARSSSVAWSHTGASISAAALAVPTRQGVHWPQLSCSKKRIMLQRRVARAVVLAQHHDRGRADEAAVRLQGVEVQRDVAHARPAGCRPTRRRAGRHRAAWPSSMPPQYSSISSRTVMPAGASLTPGCFTRPLTLKQRSPLRPWRPKPLNHCGPLLDDVAHPVERLEVVLQRGPAEQADLRDVGRAHARFAALALDALDHRGLLAADVGAGAAPQLDARQRAGRIGLELARARPPAARGSRGIRRAGRCSRPRCPPPAPRSARLRGSGADRARGRRGP